MQSKEPSRFTILIASLIASIAIVGYFVGLQSPMHPMVQTTRPFHPSTSVALESMIDGTPKKEMPSTDYGDMRQFASKTAWFGGSISYHELLQSIPDSESWQTPASMSGSWMSGSSMDAQGSQDSTAIVTASLTDKHLALATRKQNRSFNGAPPTVPHPITELSAEACVVCHANGKKTATLRIPRMSHPYLTNCTQCHVASMASNLESYFHVDNQFQGLLAPESGPRAFPGAPPQIPHSTWMREACTSCHGPTSLQGLQTTHPWRQNCQQCHAPSSTMEQSLLRTVSATISRPRTTSPLDIGVGSNAEDALNRISILRSDDESTR